LKHLEANCNISHSRKSGCPVICYNTKEECILHASQIACDIGFGGIVAADSWPSIKTLSYFQNRDKLEAAMETFIWSKNIGIVKFSCLLP